MKIKKVDRYYSSALREYTYYVTYENGDITQFAGHFKNLPEDVKNFIPAAGFQFMQSKSGEYFHRFS